MAVRKLSDIHPEAVASFVTRVETTFLAKAKEQLHALEASVVSCEKLLKSTLSQFGYKASSEEDLSKGFFMTIVEIISLSRKSSDEVDKWAEQERKAAEKAAKLNSKSSASSAKTASSSSEKEIDKKDQQNIFGNFRDQQQASSDDIILQLKKKMELRRQKAEAAQ